MFFFFKLKEEIAEKNVLVEETDRLKSATIFKKIVISNEN